MAPLVPDPHISYLLVGMVSGILFQFVSMLYYLNGRWDQVSLRKKAATTAGGGLSAILVGLWLLSGEEPMLVYRLWFYQSLAGLAGFAFLEEARNNFLRLVGRMMGGGRKGDE